MKPALMTALLLTAGFCTLGCEPKTLPPQHVPGMVQVPDSQMSTIREANHTFVKVAAGQEMRHEGFHANVGPIRFNHSNPDEYRQLMLPAGQHQISVYYRTDQARTSPYEMTVIIEPRKVYELKTLVDDVYLTLGSVGMTKVGYELIDVQTQKVVAYAGDRPATRPVEKPNYIPPNYAQVSPAKPQAWVTPAAAAPAVPALNAAPASDPRRWNVQPSATPSAQSATPAAHPWVNVNSAPATRPWVTR